MNNKNKNKNKRAFLITENEQIIFRYDNNNLKNIDFIEKDIFNMLLELEKNKEINLNKIFNMLKVYYGLTLNDCLEITKIALVDRNNENWKIINE